jgi:hypothetical protein|tara:strand:- start:230 stop:838 length:609 start_codon:yes stop_codon:yes gene_type:complete
MAGAAAIPGLLKTAGAAVLAKPALTGAVLGALTNRQDPLRGAVLGGVTGGLTGGFSGATPPTQIASQAATQAASPVLQARGLEAALGPAPMSTTNKLIADAGIQATAPTGLSKVLAVAKDKPMETARFVSALGGGEQQQAPAPSMIPLTQPGMRPVPSIEESIGMDSGPRFVSKGLFDESKREVEEEEMALMYQKLSEAGLV